MLSLVGDMAVGKDIVDAEDSVYVEDIAVVEDIADGEDIAVAVMHTEVAAAVRKLHMFHLCSLHTARTHVSAMDVLSNVLCVSILDHAHLGPLHSVDICPKYSSFLLLKGLYCRWGIARSCGFVFSFHIEGRCRNISCHHYCFLSVYNSVHSVNWA